jgi:protease PrsW
LENIASNDLLKEPHKKYHFWIHVLIIGSILYIATVVTFLFTNNSNLFPTVILVGNFLVPIAFVSFFYERRSRLSVNMASTALCFLYGGVLGTLTAAILEPVFISALNFSTSFIVGLIEELTKLIGVLLIAKHGKKHSQMDGILLGSAAGMGFAALESIGYAFTTYLQNAGNISDVVIITLLRGIASPVGHGTWTAILASVLFKESFSGGFNINHKVMGAYLTVTILHGFWDWLPFIINYIIPIVLSVLIGQITIGAIGLLLLYKRWKEAKAQPPLLQ